MVTEKQMKYQWLLWEEYHCIENTYSNSDLLRLNQIRECRTLAKNIYLERFQINDPTIASTIVGGNIRYMGYTLAGSVNEVLYSNDKQFNLFSHSVLLFERYDNYSFSMLTPPSSTLTIEVNQYVDYFLKQRSRGTAYVDELMRKEEEKLSLFNSTSGAGGDKRTHKGKSHANLEEMMATDELYGIPPLLREFINKLPEKLPTNMIIGNSHIDEFIDTLRRTVLPPRPYSDVGDGHDYMDTSLGNNTNPTNASKGLLLQSIDMENDEDEEMYTNTNGVGLGGISSIHTMGGDDIFQHRQKMRLNLQ